MESIIAGYLEKCLCVRERSVCLVCLVFGLFTRCETLSSASLLNRYGRTHQIQVFILIKHQGPTKDLFSSFSSFLKYPNT